MSYDISLPNITAQTPQAQLQQMQSYLYQLAGQLKWALNSMDQSTEKKIVQQITQSAAQASTPEQAQASFNDIKSLIINSADIVDAYYEEVSKRLAGLYVAEATFPNGDAAKYIEQTDQIISETSTKVERAFTNLQTIESDIEGFGSGTITVNASVKTGLLYYVSKNGAEISEYMEDATPVYGVEVGQKVEDNGVTTFKKFARFTSESLVFYNNNNDPVAWISDESLFISKAEITTKLRYGGFEDTVMSGGDVVTKWVK